MQKYKTELLKLSKPLPTDDGVIKVFVMNLTNKAQPDTKGDVRSQLLSIPKLHYTLPRARSI